MFKLAPSFHLDWPGRLQQLSPMAGRLTEPWVLKGTLMQIWKSRYMFVFLQKQYSENFLILTILELLAREVCKILKK